MSSRRSSEDTQPEDVLDFWLGQDPKRWFEVDPAFDREIADRFGPALTAARNGAYDDSWTTTPHGTVALIILLDQFSRNIHRGTAEMFAADKKALRLAKQLVAKDDDMKLPQHMRSWIYLPFMHSEDLADQEECVRLSARSGLDSTLYWAKVHEDIIRKFGRFPHRNHLLGRETTAAEQDFLDQGGFSG